MVCDCELRRAHGHVASSLHKPSVFICVHRWFQSLSLAYLPAPMTTREGSLEAPTRHPIDWKNPEYYDEGKILAEAQRIFDICHGCRRCVSLCNTFPTLFDLIDEGPTGEPDGVSKDKDWGGFDPCYLCDLCYVVKFPFVPPHPS